MRPPNGDLPGLLALAATQGGAVTRRQCRAYAVSTRIQRHRIATGAWRVRHRALIVLRDADPDACEAWCLQLSAGPGAMVSGPVALRLRGYAVSGDVPVVVIPRERQLHLAGVRVLHRDLPPGPSRSAGRWVSRLRLAPAYDALLDTMLAVSEPDACDLLDRALQQRWITAERFAVAVQARLGRGRAGAARARRLMARALTGSRSQAEQRLRPLLRRSGTGPWVANLPVIDPETGRIIAEVDFGDERSRVGIEVDGRAHHTDRAAFEHDRARQNELALRGWLILRFTWEQITQRPEWVIATVQQAVRLRLGDVSA